MGYEELTTMELQKHLYQLEKSLKNSQLSEEEHVVQDLHVHQIELEMQNRELRQAQRQLEQTRNRYAELYDFAPVGYFTLNHKAKIIELNLTAASMLNSDRSLIRGRPFYLWLPSEDHEALRQHITNTLESKVKVITEMRIKPHGGGLLHIRLESIAVYNFEEQAPICQTAMIDITQKKQTEEELHTAFNRLESMVRTRTVELARANEQLRVEISERQQMEESLRQSEERFRLVLTTLPVGVWITDKNGVIQLSNSEGRRIWSGTKAVPMGQNEEYKGWWSNTGKQIHTDEWALTRAISRGETSINEMIDIECFDGTRRTILNSAVPLREKNQSITGAIVVNQDITELKQAQDKLRQAATVFEIAIEGIVITDSYHRISAVNKAFSDITGFAPQDVLGKEFSILQTNLHPEEFFQAIWKSVDRNGRWQGEIWNKRKNGEKYPAWVNISSVKDNMGQIVNCVFIFSDISAIKQAEERLTHLAHHDSLTGLPNRLLFSAHLDHALERGKRNKQRVALLFLDLDKFKFINDTLGHIYGDRLLQEVAGRLKNCVRAEDTVARMGGDEFMIVLEKIAHPQDAAILADKIIETVARPFNIDGKELKISTSIGISLYPDDAQFSEDLTKESDAAMYLAKERGRNNYQFYTPELTAKAMDYLSVENGLRESILRREFVIHYQPFVAVKTKEIVGIEALVRWRHPTQGELLPVRFIEVAEHTGLIDSLDEWVLQTASSQVKSWQTAGLPPVHLAVNISGRQIMRGDSIVEKVHDALEISGLNPNCLELELNEDVLQPIEENVQKLTLLKKLGVSLVVDDFGKKGTSLSHLKSLPIDKVKIDSMFVRDLSTDANDEAVTTALIAMSHGLQMKVGGKGVETPYQLHVLQSHECDEIQGYLFSEPLSSLDMFQLLQRGNILEPRLI